MRKRYTARERRAYWIGVGHSFSSGDKETKKNVADFESSLSKKEFQSYQRGIMATVYHDDIFRKKNKRR